MRLTTLLLATLPLVLSGCTQESESNDYPDKFLLKGAAIPKGLSLADVPAELRQVGVTSNPAKVPAAALSEMNDEAGTSAHPAREAWVEALVEADGYTRWSRAPEQDDENPDLASAIVALRWSSAANLDAALRTAFDGSDGPCNAGGDFYLVDVFQSGDVLVIISSDLLDIHDDVKAALAKKNPGWLDVCEAASPSGGNQW